MLTLLLVGCLTAPEEHNEVVTYPMPPPLLVRFGDLPEVTVLDSGSYATLVVRNGDGGPDFLPSIDRLAAEPEDLYLRIQTWGTTADGFDTGVLDDIADGAYDSLFEIVLGRLAARRGATYLLFNPDMEVPAGSYPWQQYPSAYAAAYGRFAALARRYCPWGKLVWAAAGYPGADEFYPVDHPVDLAAVTILPRSEVGLEAYPRDSLPWRDAYRRVHRMRFLGLPVLVLPTDSEVAVEIGPGLADRIQKKLRSAPPGTYAVERRARDAGGPPRGEVTVGIYDPQARLLERPEVGVEHLFVDFRSLASGDFRKWFMAARDRGHGVIVTFEPLYLPDGSRDEDVLNGISAGRYDDYLNELYELLGRTAERVYFRYAHEMEIPIHRYPWQSQDPQDYIRSWRYVMSYPTFPQGVTRVWGPAGDRGSLEWYPGDEWVDVLSIAIYGLPDKNITDPRRQEPFARIFDRKWRRLRFIDKPLFITEFGVKGPEDYQTDWLLAAAATLRDQPDLIGVNYFNMSDTPQAWGEIKPPDWSITEATFSQFVGALRN